MSAGSPSYSSPSAGAPMWVGAAGCCSGSELREGKNIFCCMKSERKRGYGRRMKGKKETQSQYRS